MTLLLIITTTELVSWSWFGRCSKFIFPSYRRCNNVPTWVDLYHVRIEWIQSSHGRSTHFFYFNRVKTYLVIILTLRYHIHRSIFRGCDSCRYRRQVQCIVSYSSFYWNGSKIRCQDCWIRQVSLLATNIDHATDFSSFYRDILEALHKVGFKTNLGIHDSGFGLLALTKGGGYYLGLLSLYLALEYFRFINLIDTGTSKLIADGKIKLKTDSVIKSFTESSIVFENGTELAADVVIFATGWVPQSIITYSIPGLLIIQLIVLGIYAIKLRGSVVMSWSIDVGLSGVWIVRARLLAYGVTLVFLTCGIWWVSFSPFFSHIWFQRWFLNFVYRQPGTLSIPFNSRRTS